MTAQDYRAMVLVLQLLSLILETLDTSFREQLLKLFKSLADVAGFVA
jgi:hypothetical protein